MITSGTAMIRRVVLFGALVALLISLLHDSGGGSKNAAALSIGRVHAGYQPTTGKLFVLVIGNDARHGNPNGALADAIHLWGSIHKP